MSGRVQGVWFRQTCRDRAAALDVAGWVRNLTDGRVEVAIEGRPSAVDALVGWCHEGPARAAVTGVEILDEAPEGLQGFRVS